MDIKVYNTLTRNKEVFVPIKKPKVGMYVCGVTVYDDCHLGHARAVVTFDVIYRFLKSAGYAVTFVRNFTDIDDKIIDRANKEGVAWSDISEKYIEAFHRDMKALGNVKPDHEPKATEHIDDMIEIIKKLIDNGMAYAAGGDVFYSVRKKEDYGKLSGKNIDELESGARIEVVDIKKDPLDFVLWKASKPHEPSWESPWGAGRPGWHIECSAMSMRFLGNTLDIHGGGRDLCFPHHENEIAQSEGATGDKFCNYWIHNGFVNINAEKMSKSLGNFLSIQKLLQIYSSEVIRLFILSAHYRSPLDYTEENLQMTKNSLLRWYTTMARLQSACNNNNRKDVDVDLEKKIASLYDEFNHAMSDDFNTAKVVGLLFERARDFNKLFDEGRGTSAGVCESFLDQVKKIHAVLGLFGSDPHEFLEAEKQRGLGNSNIDSAVIEGKLEQRKQARHDKNWALADQIRDELLKDGIQIKDNPDGTTSWTVE